MASQTTVSNLTLTVLAGLCSLSPILAQEEGSPATTWTNVQGKTIEADFVRLTDDGVVLRLKANGREAEVPIATLDIDSHLQAIRLGNEEAFAKPLPTAKVEIEPLEPSNLVDVDATLKSPFSGSETIDQFIATVKREYLGGNYFVIWHCIPTKLQNDIEDLAVKSVGKIGTTPIVQIRTLLKDAKTIVWEKQEFLFNHPMIAGNPMVASELEKQWPLIREYVASLSQDELWQPENFEKGKIIPWAAQLMAAFGQYHDALNEATDGKQNAALDSMLRVTEQTKDSAKLEFTAEGLPPQTVSAKRFETDKIWIVAAWIKQLRESVDNGLKQIESAPDLSGPIQGALALTVAPALTALKNAETQEEFNQAVANIQAIASSFAPPPSSQPAGGQSVGGRGQGRSGGSGSSPGRPTFGASGT